MSPLHQPRDATILVTITTSDVGTLLLCRERCCPAIQPTDAEPNRDPRESPLMVMIGYGGASRWPAVASLVPVGSLGNPLPSRPVGLA